MPQGARLFYVSGQVGVDLRGKLQAGIDKQVEQVWKNIGQVLKSAGMGYRRHRQDHHLPDRQPLHRALPRGARPFFPATPYPASTLLIVAGLADPGMLVEIEVVAAK